MSYQVVYLHHGEGSRERMRLYVNERNTMELRWEEAERAARDIAAQGHYAEIHWGDHVVDTYGRDERPGYRAPRDGGSR